MNRTRRDFCPSPKWAEALALLPRCFYSLAATDRRTTVLYAQSRIQPPLHCTLGLYNALTSRSDCLRIGPFAARPPNTRTHPVWHPNRCNRIFGSSIIDQYRQYSHLQSISRQDILIAMMPKVTQPFSTGQQFGAKYQDFSSRLCVLFRAIIASRPIFALYWTDRNDCRRLEIQNSV